MPKQRTPSGAPFTASVWVLLTRHVTSKKVEAGAGPVAVSDGSYAQTSDATHVPQQEEQFLTLHVYARRNGHRVFLPHGALHRGKYTNNQHWLLSPKTILPTSHKYYSNVKPFDLSRSWVKATAIM